MIKIMPDQTTIDRWIHNCTFEYDVFYMTGNQLETFRDHLKNALIYTKKEFFNSTLANDIHYINSYRFWSMDNAVTHLIKAQAGWIETIPHALRHKLLTLQHELGRGFIHDEKIPGWNNYFIENKTILTSYMLCHLSHQAKAEILLGQVEAENDHIVMETRKKIPTHIRDIANTFSETEGSNCFGAVLFAVTKNRFFLSEWVAVEPFMSGLENNGYARVGSTPKKYDIIVWKDDGGRVRHACYGLGDGLYFNKSGQTVYNPWKIAGWREMDDDWGHYEYEVYRKEGRSFK